MTAELEAREIVWQEERRTLTLTGETVLEVYLSWPKVGGKHMRNVDRYYTRGKNIGSGRAIGRPAQTWHSSGNGPDRFGCGRPNCPGR